MKGNSRLTLKSNLWNEIAFCVLKGVFVIDSLIEEHF